MLSEYIFYRLGKRKARKEQVSFIDSLREEEESEVIYVESQEQDSRSFEQLLQEARKNRANKNNQ